MECCWRVLGEGHVVGVGLKFRYPMFTFRGRGISVHGGPPQTGQLSAN